MALAQLSGQQEEILAGLNASQATINPKFFYDEHGSELFAQICELKEYYPTRTEKRILTDNGESIANAVGDVSAIIEPGAGACKKIRLLLDDIAPDMYIPMDISAEFLQQAARLLRSEFPQISIEPIVADFNQRFKLPEISGRRLLYYPGSTIGNFTPDQAADFLKRCADMLGSNGGLLIGIDKHKDSAVLNAAYNDSQGVTAAFNLNILNCANQVLEANFNLDRFSHRAFYNEREHRIEMHLVSSQSQIVEHALGTLSFAAGESIQTEYSYKYSGEDFQALAGKAGLLERAYWCDPQEWFGVYYFEVV